MKTKSIVLLALLLGIGAVLHLVIPGAILGMKPDLMLTMMFLGIILFPTVKHVAALGVAAGLLSGLTSTFPGGGFIPNLIEKPITAFVFFAALLLVKKVTTSTIALTVLTALGTAVSGFVFLGIAFTIIGLPGPFLALVTTVVVPAAIGSAVLMFILYPIVMGILKRTTLLEDSLHPAA
ncbi:tryptophan transporter [Mangrovibacillus cuniculi]|uniref:Tryptophan transporter n=1 Tax=Mangrovibacillus cuniculi TaxID=2593652 RepID=A0A7S8C9S4_9BACI|nr:tryptophan transporter [Mangrovibacillus cuniculi]QPC45993.1 tryptophan transporter [Mangrovibacillus cuniculi]